MKSTAETRALKFSIVAAALGLALSSTNLTALQGAPVALRNSAAPAARTAGSAIGRGVPLAQVPTAPVPSTRSHAAQPSRLAIPALTAHLPALGAALPVIPSRGALQVPGVRGLRTTTAGTQSTNWSGYVANGGALSYTHVFGRWHVPTVNVTPDDRYSATWVGIGGDPTVDLIQAGSGADSAGGKTSYYVWTEILPEPETPAFAVNPGDSISVDINNDSPLMWTMTVTDETINQHVTVQTPYTSLGLTAEWIHEAPTVGGTQSALASTNNVVFDDATANGTSISANNASTIQMVDANNQPIATPSALDVNGDGFQVADSASRPPVPES